MSNTRIEIEDDKQWLPLPFEYDPFSGHKENSHLYTDGDGDQIFSATCSAILKNAAVGIDSSNYSLPSVTHQLTRDLRGAEGNTFKVKGQQSIIQEQDILAVVCDKNDYQAAPCIATPDDTKFFGVPDKDHAIKCGLTQQDCNKLITLTKFIPPDTYLQGGALGFLSTLIFINPLGSKMDDGQLMSSQIIPPVVVEKKDGILFLELDRYFSSINHPNEIKASISCSVKEDKDGNVVFKINTINILLSPQFYASVVFKDSDPKSRSNKELSNQLKKIVPMLIHKEALNGFSEEYSRVNSSRQAKIYTMVKDILEEQQGINFIERQKILFDLRVLQDLHYRIGARVKKSFSDIFEIKSDASGTEKAKAVALGFYKLPELFLAVLEDAAKFCINRTIWLWTQKHNQSKWEMGALTFFSLIAAAGLLVEIPARFLLQRLTSPVRSFNEAYAFGAQYGGKPAGWVAAGLSAAVSLGLMAVASVFLAPFVAAVLTKMGLSAVVGGANTAVNAVSSTFIGTAAGGVASVSMGVISSVGMTVSLVWGGLVAAWEGLKYAGKKLGSTSSITPSSPVTTQASKSKLEVDVGGGSTTTINAVPHSSAVVSSPTAPDDEEKREFDSEVSVTSVPAASTSTSTSSTPPLSHIEETQKDESPKSTSSTEEPKDQSRQRSRSFGSNP